MDTCIWIDFYENRKSKYEDFGKAAFMLLTKLRASNTKIVVSDYLLRELESNYSLGEIRSFTFYFAEILEKVAVSDMQMQEAKNIAKERMIPKGDVVQAIIARDYGAVLVSRDKHFVFLSDICICLKPEELI